MPAPRPRRLLPVAAGLLLASLVAVVWWAAASAATREDKPGGTSRGASGARARAGSPAAVTSVSTVEGLEVALATARPGDVITVAAGVYRRDGGDRWVAAANGTAAAPITLQGTRASILESDGPRGDYGLHILGDQWRVTGITIRSASKGVVLDGSVGTVLDGIEVAGIGDEGVHFRWCSSNGVLRNSYVHDTGLDSPQYGEGVYVGSASSNWSKYSCTDGRDNSENVLVEDNVFRRIPAEGADLKEGTDSGTLRRNVFERTGYSGENSADSAVDAKGNGWAIWDNDVRSPSGANLDAFQTHVVYSGYGTRNVFRGNTVQGTWPGFGFGLSPQSANVVSCDNRATGAALGLVGSYGAPVRCAG